MAVTPSIAEMGEEIMTASFEPLAEADLVSLQAAIAGSPIVVHQFVRPIADWATIRQSAEVDAFVLAWIASHVTSRPGGRSA
jgi:hypothetical protein